MEEGRRIGLIGMARCYEDARTDFVVAIAGPERAYSEDWLGFLRQCTVEMLGDATFPEVLTVGAGVLRIGTTSYSHGFGIFQRGVCVSLSDAVVVWVNANGRPRVAGEDVKAQLRKEMLHL